MEESIHRLILSWIGRQFTFSNSLILILLLSPSFRQILIHLFWAACKRFFKFLLRLGTKRYMHKQRKVVSLLYVVIYKEECLKRCLCQYKNLNLEFTLFITWVTTDSPEGVSSRIQSNDVSFAYCLIFMSL